MKDFLISSLMTWLYPCWNAESIGLLKRYKIFATIEQRCTYEQPNKYNTIIYIILNAVRLAMFNSQSKNKTHSCMTI